MLKQALGTLINGLLSLSTCRHDRNAKLCLSAVMDPMAARLFANI